MPESCQLPQQLGASSLAQIFRFTAEASSPLSFAMDAVAMTQAQLKVLVRDACSRKIAEFQAERAQFKAGMKRCSEGIRKEKKKTQP